MTRINKITLITETITTDDIGQPKATEATLDVIAEVRSITQSEYMNARQSGITPAYSFRISVFAYGGQKVLKYDGTRYRIYRTYEADDNTIELYAEYETGVSNV